MRNVFKAFIIGLSIPILFLAWVFLLPSNDIVVDSKGRVSGFTGALKQRLQGERFWRRQIEVIDRRILQLQQRITSLNEAPEGRALLDSISAAMDSESEAMSDRLFPPSPAERRARELERAAKSIREEEYERQVREVELEQIENLSQFIAECEQLKRIIQSERLKD